MRRVLVVLGMLVLVAAITAPAGATNAGRVEAHTPPGVFPSLRFAWPADWPDLEFLWHGSWDGYAAQLTEEDVGGPLDFGGTFVLHGRRSATLSYSDPRACLRDEFNSTTRLPGEDEWGCVRGTLDVSLTWTRIDPSTAGGLATVSGYVTFEGRSLIDPAALVGYYGFAVHVPPD